VGFLPTSVLVALFKHKKSKALWGTLVPAQGIGSQDLGYGKGCWAFVHLHTL
jgi:hypothetical protein